MASVVRWSPRPRPGDQWPQVSRHVDRDTSGRPPAGDQSEPISFILAAQECIASEDAARSPQSESSGKPLSSAT